MNKAHIRSFRIPTYLEELIFFIDMCDAIVNKDYYLYTRVITAEILDSLTGGQIPRDHSVVAGLVYQMTSADEQRLRVCRNLLTNVVSRPSREVISFEIYNDVITTIAKD